MLTDAAVRLHLTAHEALSGVFGSVSLAAWIFLLVLENRNLSGHLGNRINCS